MSMTGEERRAWLKDHLKGTTPIAGHELSALLGVSRQVIVQDIALLRAEGYPIISTPRGYLFWEKPTGSIRTVVAVKHASSPEVVREELTTMVKSGVTVVNVIVAHPLYGELVGNLNLSTLDDVDRFMQNMQQMGASLLSELTDGVHLHTLEGAPDTIERAKWALAHKGFLLQASS
ncbi:hypothetical protein SAMN00768000_3206 [Sulfobacillus thermosulfidooxidans DSM 9293]|uniref:Transcription repressor NadR n=3 Tax=Sulfobacillus thermosulfidooxidans TaxID=28034 RepID=A0A1W1WLI9_SULTA|nr:MAG: transcription repressor NadR [Sulfobacillus thermosulfidooxidans]SMC07105.1 hypothetical protein SAMN00768000_3206 [Sulfobacillus thermosulfidooxidans DSM 9293]